MRFLSSTWLSLSAFTPTLLLLALILHPQLGLWSWVLAGCGAVSVTLTVASVASLSRRQATPIESTSVRRRDTEVYAFTFASLLPIAPALLIDNAGSASVVSLGLTALLVMLHLRGGLFHLNAFVRLGRLSVLPGDRYQRGSHDDAHASAACAATGPTAVPTPLRSRRFPVSRHRSVLVVF